MPDHPSSKEHKAEKQADIDVTESIVDKVPWVLPLVGAALIFLLAFIAVTMA